MKNLLSQRMENSRAWWSGQLHRRNEESDRALSIDLTAAFAIALFTIGFVEMLGRHL